MNSFNYSVLIIGLILIAVVAWQTYVIYGLKGNLESKERNSDVNYLDLLDEEPARMSAQKSLNLFQEIQTIQKEFDNTFRRFSTNFADEPSFKLAFSNFFYAPSLDVVSRDEKYIIKTDIPGVKRSDIKISAEGNVLNIKAEANIFHDENASKYIRKERYMSKFQRSVLLADDADLTNLEHKYEDGVLIITIPKKK
ncbi:Hsp20/alpha crystallin family protein [bacterium]|nr:Hsp20/alpha crystallin family protein [bacterium]MBU1433585.1 Hsp20/alpha crystallin family protein [bacterium]MBU1503234.1 Hsp20/alpha crystallin family protein [bacterium]